MKQSHDSRAGLYAPATRDLGFTLIELMITVVIASILMTVAFPVYLHQIRESRRTDARSALLDLASREERYYAINNAYTAAATDLGYPSFPHVVGSGYYTISAPTNINAATATSPATFTLSATPVAGMGQDRDSDCQTFTVTQAGQDTSTNSASVDSTSTCWSQ